MSTITGKDGIRIHDEHWGLVGRRVFVTGGLMLALAAAGGRAAGAAGKPTVQVHKSPT